MATAEDLSILQRGLAERRTVVTLDADFHTILALSGASAPSVTRIRREALKSAELSELLAEVCVLFEGHLLAGAAITVGETSARCRLLPIG